MLRFILCLSLAGAVFSAPAVAQQKSSERNPVADSGAGTIAVVNQWASRDDDIWCVAAKAALQRGAAWRDRLYVVGVASAAQSQYGAETITFTFRPSADQLAQAKSGSSSVRGIGNNLSINAANRRCQREPDFY
ncbi:hypothetical protein BXY66_1988 [Shimia isoporae]|uniref:Uncharacterized protein n=1 Tax=Shimia isoporae TaxID=647720 RepID=A0A4R1NPY4_9RHOB|nr:hypothetical protein [Shimia isoporae]TCL09921.1 hypothetical protein BXY66_1988 [Shimia isoporae]